jgi:hypothetical protein
MLGAGDGSAVGRELGIAVGTSDGDDAGKRDG